MRFNFLLAALVVWLFCGIGCGTTKPADDTSAAQGTVTPSVTPVAGLTVTPSVSPTGGAAKPKASPTAGASKKEKETPKADSKEKKSENKSGGNSGSKDEVIDANAAETANQENSGQDPSEDAGTGAEGDGGYEVDTEDKGENELPEVEIPNTDPADQPGKQTEKPARNTEPETAEQGNTGTDDEGVYVDESGNIVLPEIEF